MIYRDHFERNGFNLSHIVGPNIQPSVIKQYNVTAEFIIGTLALKIPRISDRIVQAENIGMYFVHATGGSLLL